MLKWWHGIRCWFGVHVLGETWSERNEHPELGDVELAHCKHCDVGPFRIT